MSFVDVQDSIERPFEIYRGLYELLGLRWTTRVSDRLQKRFSSSRGTASGLPNRAHVTNRRLSDINTYGKTLLSPDEVKIIESINADLWHEVQAACCPFYPAAALVMGAVLYGVHRGQYVSFVIWLFMITPFVRRVVDSQLGYQDVSIVTLAPQLAAAVDSRNPQDKCHTATAAQFGDENDEGDEPA